MVTSGKSARRCESTSPMLINRESVECEEVAAGTADESHAAAAADPPVIVSALVGPRSCHEHQPELADLDLVAVAQGGGLDALAVDVGAVEAADVADGERAALAVELGVAPGHGHVVEEDVAVG